MLRNEVQDVLVSPELPGAFRISQYNTEHQHSGLRLRSSSDVHHAIAEAHNTTRADILTDAYAARLERFLL